MNYSYSPQGKLGGIASFAHIQGLKRKTHEPLARAASHSHPSYTRETRVLVASFLSLLPPPSSAPLLSPRRRRGDQECETGLTEESIMGGEKETFDMSDLNASLPAAAAGNRPLRRHRIAYARP